MSEPNQLPIISCDGCGACCLEQSTPPGYLVLAAGLEWPEPEDVQRFAELPADAKASLVHYQQQVASGEACDAERPCIWLDTETMRCRHYEQRPQICRDFERGSGACLAWREEYGIESEPGKGEEE
jgi:uncharacterized protein